MPKEPLSLHTSPSGHHKGLQGQEFFLGRKRAGPNHGQAASKGQTGLVCHRRATSLRLWQSGLVTALHDLEALHAPYIVSLLPAS